MATGHDTVSKTEYSLFSFWCVFVRLLLLFEDLINGDEGAIFLGKLLMRNTNASMTELNLGCNNSKGKKKVIINDNNSINR